MLGFSKNYWECSREQNMWPQSQEAHPQSLQTQGSAETVFLSARRHTWLFVLPHLSPKQLIISASADTYGKHVLHFLFVLNHLFQFRRLYLCLLGGTYTNVAIV